MEYFHIGYGAWTVLEENEENSRGHTKGGALEHAGEREHISYFSSTVARQQNTAETDEVLKEEGAVLWDWIPQTRNGFRE